jgi:chemotaxis response regulator CheB
LTSIILADDHDIVRRDLRDLIERHPRWPVCGEARDGLEAVELAAALRRLPAAENEAAVVEQVRALLRQPEVGGRHLARGARQ